MHWVSHSIRIHHPQTTGENQKVKVRKDVLIMHDFDNPLFTRRTCFRRAFWLVMYALFGWSLGVRSKMPKWFMYEKYSQALAVAIIDKMLNINAVFAFRKCIDDAFPTLREEIERLGFRVINHWHGKTLREGCNQWKARGEWADIGVGNTYLNYDRHYVLGERVIPEKNTNVIWHIDHMSYNLRFYLEFIHEMLT